MTAFSYQTRWPNRWHTRWPTGWIAIAAAVCAGGCSITFDPAGTLTRRTGHASYVQRQPSYVRPQRPRPAAANAPRSRRTVGTAVHVVQRGESLAGLARTYGTTIGALVERNRLATARLMPGQRLIVPRRAY
ncbi:MAG: LysM peptidoglycan-binding domain-containing protein [Hyphomicrobiaceae bacterium]|nr:LysM peptidoglycan-binding domain-containing protein [Hyphomicrobiaceae bacterium]